MFTQSLVFAALPYYGGALVFALWATSIVWTYRDMRARSRNTWSRCFVALFVGVLNLPGLLIYWLMRPRETLRSAYLRALEEEALLQEIERSASCPNCAQATERSWQICPHCHTQLRRSCHSCKSMLALEWSRCPSCLAVQTNTRVQPDGYQPQPTALESEALWPEEELSYSSFAPSGSDRRLQPTYERFAEPATNGYSDVDLEFALTDSNEEY